ncbi:MAG TPA: glycosyltransferase [Acidimicrobiales bacterium]|nr:glycosyltransferase [Acidimicrobiales bacterium]
MNYRKKLVYISSVAVPQQVEFCNALQEYFDARFWFYEYPDRTRGSWWQVDLGKHCKVLERVLFPKSGPFAERYLALGLSNELERFDPDIVMLGGFSIPSNYLGYRWARRKGKKTIVFTERSRDASGVLRKRGFAWRLQHRLYCDVDMVMVSDDDTVAQFRDEFRFGDKVVAGRYAADLDAYFEHPFREAKPAYTYLFANRMTEIYNPIGAIEIFAAVRAKYRGSRLVMNAAGELGELCRARIGELGIGDAVEFLTNIKSWGELHKVYACCDILILPANFSNGNFTILEAMASGMGVVVSDRVLGIGKIVEDGKNGFNCEPTTKAFLNRIERYIQQPELFRVHAGINRPLVEPHSARGTARSFFDIVTRRFGCHDKQN